MPTTKNTFKLSIFSPIQPFGAIPSKITINDAAKRLLESSNTWKMGKTYFKSVKTYYLRPKVKDDGPCWHCRVSEHPESEVGFDALWGALSVNKAETEREYVPELQKTTKIMEVSPTQQIWSLSYKFPQAMVANRVFTIFQDISLDEVSGCRSGIVVSIPVDLSADHTLAQMEEKGVKGRYVSVEQVKELGDGKVEWRVAVSSTAAGFIPEIFTDMTLPCKLSKDVPLMVRYLQNKKKSRTS